MKITTKTTKEQLVKFIGANVKAVKEQDKDLFDRIAYTDKAMKDDDSKVTRTDLVSLAKDIIKLLGDKIIEPDTSSEQATPTAENSTKLRKNAEKKANKSVGKDTTDDDTDSSKGTVQTMFPKTLELGDTSYELATEIKDMEDLFKAIENEEQIVFAFYWTKAHLKQFPYFNELLGKFKKFDNDLDLATCMYMSDEKRVAYMLSAYTEAFYTIIPDFLEEVDGIRYAQGIEFQIYKAV